MTDLKAKRAAFRTLHEQGCFVLPNPWDIGGVRRLEKLGFAALASTSAGMAWALGLEDGEVALDDVLSHLRLLCGSTDLPVNADFEAGFADDPKEVAANVRLACDTGVAGLSIEDRTGRELYPLSLAVERIQASREAIDQAGEDVILVGRSEGFLVGRTRYPRHGRTARRLCRGRCGLSVRSRHSGSGAHRSGRRRRRAEAGQCPSDGTAHADCRPRRAGRPARERRRLSCARRMGRFR